MPKTCMKSENTVLLRHDDCVLFTVILSEKDSMSESKLHQTVQTVRATIFCPMMPYCGATSAIPIDLLPAFCRCKGRFYLASTCTAPLFSPSIPLALNTASCPTIRLANALSTFAPNANLPTSSFFLSFISNLCFSRRESCMRSNAPDQDLISTAFGSEELNEAVDAIAVGL